MIIALNQYWYLDLELDLPSTDIDLALSTGRKLELKLELGHKLNCYASCCKSDIEKWPNNSTESLH